MTYPLDNDSKQQPDNASPEGSDTVETAVIHNLLTSTQNKYRGLFEASPVALWEENLSGVKQYVDQLRKQGVTDFKTYFSDHPEAIAHCIGLVKVVDVNNSTVKMYGAKSKADLLNNLRKVFGNKAADTFIEELLVICNGETLYENEVKNYSLDGRELDVFVKWSVTPGFEQSYAQIIVSVVDITTSKRSAEQLRLQAAALESVVNAIVISDEKGDILWVNPAFTKLTGYTYNEVLGESPGILHPDKNSESFYQELWQTIQAGQVWSGEELLNRRKDGTSYFEKMTIAPVRNENDTISRFVAIKEDITDRKEAEDRLREAKEYAEQLLRVVPSAIITVDADRVITSWNQKAVELFGYEPEEAIGQHCKLFALEPCRTLCGLFAEEITKPIHGVECLVKRKDGHILSVVKNADILKDASGQIIGGIESFEDISNQKQLESQLRRQIQEEELLRQVVALTTSKKDLIKTITAICELMANFYKLPKSAFAILNADGTQSEVITEFRLPGQPSSIGQLIPVANNPSMQHLIHKKTPLAIKDAQADPRLASVHDAMRQLGIASILIIPVLIGDKFVGSMGFDAIEPKDFSADDIELGQQVAQHISQVLLRKQAEQAIQDQRDFANQIMNNMGQGLFVANSSWTIEYCNVAFSELLGYSPAELLGKSAMELVNEVTPEKMETVYAGWLRDEAQSREAQFIHNDGSLKQVLVTAVPHKHDKSIAGTIVVVTDLTKQKQIEEALASARDQAVEASRLKSEFLANMSHEIRTPLNAVIGMTSLMLETPLTPDQQEFSETIRNSGDVLLSLINDILDLSKIEAGKLELEKRPFSIRDCAEEAIDVVINRASGKGLELAYSIEETVPNGITGDVTRIRQVLVNLLNNAIKFTETGEILLTISSTQSKLQPENNIVLRFSVKDTGIGIPTERLNRLFKSFSQVDASTTRKYGGTGLGLAISKQLVELMGGEIWVESKFGKGSTFHFTVITQAANIPQRSHSLKSQPALNGKRLLIVDDNQTNRTILAKQTQLWGIKPTTAASGKDALTLLQAGQTFDLAVLDMQMPEMNGVMLAAEIRKQVHGNALPLVVLSSIGDREEYKDVPYFTAFLTKPVKQQHLFDTLMGVLADTAVLPKLPLQQLQIDPEMGKKHPLRILLAEDNLINQKVAVRLLERMGYRADKAADGKEVLEALQRQTYDVILMDVQMPNMDGVEATQQIHETWPPEKRPHIIAMTAHALTGDREKYLKAGMDNYISKPVRIEELFKALSECHPLTRE
jgi:PAS domain S-box-containing protein